MLNGAVEANDMKFCSFAGSTASDTSFLEGGNNAQQPRTCADSRGCDFASGVAGGRRTTWKSVQFRKYGVGDVQLNGPSRW
jgi:hypothetical protein